MLVPSITPPQYTAVDSRTLVECKAAERRRFPLAGHVLTALFPQREGGMEDDQAEMEGENGTRFEEYEWCGQKRIRATSLLEGGFRGKRPDSSR